MQINGQRFPFPSGPAQRCHTPVWSNQSPHCGRLMSQPTWTRTSTLYSLERRKRNIMALDKKHIGFFEGVIFYLLLMSILPGAGSRKEGRLRRRGEPPPHYSVVHDKCCKQLWRHDSFVPRTPSRNCLLIMSPTQSVCVLLVRWLLLPVNGRRGSWGALCRHLKQRAKRSFHAAHSICFALETPAYVCLEMFPSFFVLVAEYLCGLMRSRARGCILPRMSFKQRARRAARLR